MPEACFVPAGPEPSNPVPRLSLLQWNSNLPRANPEVFFLKGGTTVVI